MAQKRYPTYSRPEEAPEDLTLSRADYEAELAALQSKLQAIQTAYISQRRRAVIVFEGWDTAGKGGTIKRMLSVLDPRAFKVWPIGPPGPVAAEHHFLYRFWERLPEHGNIAVFDRSWYGRVLVERVEGFASDREWELSYGQINSFESMLITEDYRILKLFLHITPEIQRKRFLQRLKDPARRWKLAPDDFRNRRNWEAYRIAADEMFRRTSTEKAPWVILPFHDKKYGRIAALHYIVEELSDGVDLTPPKLSKQILELSKEEFGAKTVEDYLKNDS